LLNPKGFAVFPSFYRPTAGQKASGVKWTTILPGESTGADPEKSAVAEQKR